MDGPVAGRCFDFGPEENMGSGNSQEDSDREETPSSGELAVDALIRFGLGAFTIGRGHNPWL